MFREIWTWLPVPSKARRRPAQGLERRVLIAGPCLSNHLSLKG